MVGKLELMKGKKMMREMKEKTRKKILIKHIEKVKNKIILSKFNLQ